MTPSTLLATLNDWADQGGLRQLDSALPRWIAQQEPSSSPALLLLTAVLARLEGLGHTGLPLHLSAAGGLDQTALGSVVDLLDWPSVVEEAFKTLAQDLLGPGFSWEALHSNRLVRCLQKTAHHADPLVLDAEDLGQPLVLQMEEKGHAWLSLRRYWVYQNKISQAIAQRTQISTPIMNPIAPDASPERPQDLEKTRALLDSLFPASVNTADPLPNWQKIACALALRGQLTVITGGPGTGKTFTAARVLVAALASAPQPDALRVALAAPTGKAAARLRQSIEQALPPLRGSLRSSWQLGPAKTLHALLGRVPGSRRFKYNAQNPLPLDLLIVDETSMVHVEMMASLLEALPQSAKLVMLGDKDQLASVEAGSVLGDLCAQADGAFYDPATLAYLTQTTGCVLPSKTPPAESALAHSLNQQTVMLRHSHRFGSDIGQLAEAVRQGQVDAVAAFLKATQTRAGTPDSTSPKTSPVESMNPIPADVVALAVKGRRGSTALPSYADYLQVLKSGRSEALKSEADHNAWVRDVLTAFDTFRILCAVHEGPWGDRTLNQAVQQGLVQAGWLSASAAQGDWFEGLPVLVTRNDPGVGVFNGDVGLVLTSLTGGLRFYSLDGEALRSVAVSRLQSVETAFAMTIHKSQGSEFAHTALVLPDRSGPLLTRELLYTGMTRARTHLSLFEPTPGLVAQAVHNPTRRLSQGLS